MIEAANDNLKPSSFYYRPQDFISPREEKELQEFMRWVFTPEPPMLLSYPGGKEKSRTR